MIEFKIFLDLTWKSQIKTFIYRLSLSLINVCFRIPRYGFGRQEPLT